MYDYFTVRSRTVFPKPAVHSSDLFVSLTTISCFPVTKMSLAGNEGLSQDKYKTILSARGVCIVFVSVWLVERLESEEEMITQESILREK